MPIRVKLVGMQHLSRPRAAELGRHTAQILHEGRYRAPSGALVHLRHLVRGAVEATEEHAATDDLDLLPAPGPPTTVTVVNTDSLSAAHELVVAGHRPLVLCFASATHSGGGWLSGARAQEESLARSSALVACQQGRAFYEVHQQQADPIYTDHAIWSPGVPVFRDHPGGLLETPWTTAMLTAAAVNTRRLREQDRRRLTEVDKVMRQRIERVLHIAAHHGHDALVLGAWGCGAFRNDPEAMAERFRDALRGSFAGQFRAVCFAIVDWSQERRFLAPFARAFGCPTT